MYVYVVCCINPFHDFFRSRSTTLPAPSSKPAECLPWVSRAPEGGATEWVETFRGQREALEGLAPKSQARKGGVS